MLKAAFVSLPIAMEDPASRAHEPTAITTTASAAGLCLGVSEPALGASLACCQSHSAGVLASLTVEARGCGWTVQCSAGGW